MHCMFRIQAEFLYNHPIHSMLASLIGEQVTVFMSSPNEQNIVSKGIVLVPTHDHCGCQNKNTSTADTGLKPIFIALSAIIAYAIHPATHLLQ